ncbi:MAG: PEP-CTERM sorting domain-containing protein [Puniceicoccaceae bacterium]
MCRKCAAILFVKSTRVIIASLLLVSAVAEAAVVVHNSGVTTYSQNFGNGSSITVTGGEATFVSKINRSSGISIEGGIASFTNLIDRSATISIAGGDATFAGTVGRESEISVTGGIAIFTGTIERNPTFNLSGGITELATVGNDPIFNLSGNAQLNLTGTVGRNVSFDIRDAAQLTISAPNMFSSISELIAVGGSIDSNGYDFSVDETVVSGLTVFDLGGGSNAVDLGTISGGGQLIFTNYNQDTEIYFDAFGTFDPGTQLIFDGSSSLVFDTYITPVPEPAVATLVMLLASGGFVYVRRRQQKKK